MNIACTICGDVETDGEDGICAYCWDDIHGTVDHNVIDLAVADAEPRVYFSAAFAESLTKPDDL